MIQMIFFHMVVKHRMAMTVAAVWTVIEVKVNVL
jgi:hypothetical protein